MVTDTLSLFKVSFYSRKFEFKVCSNVNLTRGWTWHIFQQGSAEYFLGFEFGKSVFLGVLVIAAGIFGLSSKSCIFNCFTFSTISSRSSFIH